ncbi:Peroxisomal membrane protein 4 [Phytophthora boehmeriae]|uniref:Peroxisomal membrane protein 4 n=1 Tax=Phytophthora boehmeriae TaxID=109152 RepID=A0A8T1XDV4_9STRA|nr:Peroxisomal membrane protein 4 [Phytophthora boehmeriae]
MIINGTAVFSDLLFTGTGEFTLTFHAGEGITEEVVRVVVHPDHIAEALEMRCDALFSRFQCSSRPSSPTSRNHQQHELQTLLLQRSLQLNAISCEQYWLVSIGGLTFSGLSLHGDVVYTMPRSLYILSTNTDVPHADMSPWDLLGLREGAVSRADIRRAYHRKSLEWHPDKWHSLLVALPSVWQQELIAIYALVSQAYDQLLRN